MLKLFAFLAGLACGAVFGSLLVAFITPAPGEETRRKIRNLVVPPPIDLEGNQIGIGPRELSVSTVQVAWRARFDTALEAARRVQAESTADMMRKYREAQQTGKSPTLM